MQSITRIDDIDNQNVSNYSYDLNGRLVSDVHDGVTLIKWSKSDKVLEVHKPNGVLTIKYNALDQKISQSTSRNDSIVTEYFVYDPSGNVLASYGDTVKVQNFNVVSHKFSLHQLTIYGSSRIGLIEVDSLLWKDGVSNVVVSNVYSQKLGLKRYELSNHLGNVQTVISDRKLVDSHSNGQITAYNADVISVSDYYAFGMKITERTWSSDSYRFGFNGKDFFSDWNLQDYGFRAYDPRICRFISIDPLTSLYPELTPYQFASNSPITMIDLDGAESKLTEDKEIANKATRGSNIREPFPYKMVIEIENQSTIMKKPIAADANYFIYKVRFFAEKTNSEGTISRTEIFPKKPIVLVENKAMQEGEYAGNAIIPDREYILNAADKDVYENGFHAYDLSYEAFNIPLVSPVFVHANTSTIDGDTKGCKTFCYEDGVETPAYWTDLRLDGMKSTEAHKEVASMWQQAKKTLGAKPGETRVTLTKKSTPSPPYIPTNSQEAKTDSTKQEP